MPTATPEGSTLMRYLLKMERAKKVVTVGNVFSKSQMRGYADLLRIGYVEEVASEMPLVPGKLGQRRSVQTTSYGRARYQEQSLLRNEEIDLSYELT